MRISSGALKGRKIASRKSFSQKGGGDELRPTSSKVRESVFDILRGEVQDSTFLDLYAGTGTVGFEALSRGAAKSCFVESSSERVLIIRDCIEKIGLADKASVYRERAEDFLKRVSQTGMSFDIIFADPPYASDELINILPLIDDTGVLKIGGCLMVEHASRYLLPGGMHFLRLVKNYRYGDTMLTLYRKEPR